MTASPVLGVLGARQHGKTMLTLGLLLRLMVREKASVFPDISGAVQRFDQYPYQTFAPQWQRCQTTRFSSILVDCPQWQGWLMGGALPALDGAVLVLSSQRGIEDQTREALVFLRQTCLGWLVVFLNHPAGADPEALDRLELEARQALHIFEIPGDDIHFVRGDALTAFSCKGSDDVACRPLDELAALLPTIQPRFHDPEAPLLLPAVSGHTSYWRINPETRRQEQSPLDEQRCNLLGRLQQGRLRVGDEVALTLSGQGESILRVSSLSAFGESLSEAGPGDCLKVELAASPRLLDFRLPDFRPNAIVAAPGQFRFRQRLRARFTLFRTDERGRRSLRSGSKPLFWIGCAQSKGLVTLDERRSLLVGEEGTGTVELERGCYLIAGQTFACRHKRGALAAGEITELP
jgi:translation elongation factor EF-Tu-like GTPase